MKLIIDIPEETVNEIKDNAMFADSISSDIRWDVTSAIVNGIPLNKIRAEIDNMPKLYPHIDHMDTYVKVADVFAIIDKYRGGE